MRDIYFYILNIEKGIIEALKGKLGVDADPPGYVKQVRVYNGELNAVSLKAAIAKMMPYFPLMFVSYVNGKDSRAPWDSGLPDDPMVLRKDCRFAVVCCSTDARGTDASPGVYQMMADAVTVLAGRRVEAVDNDETVFVNLLPFVPSGDHPIIQLPSASYVPSGEQPKLQVPSGGITAYAVYFDTYFEYETADRRPEPITIEAVNLGVHVLNSDISSPGGQPGVNFE